MAGRHAPRRGADAAVARGECRRAHLCALALLAAVACLPRAAAYSPNPFQGQGVAPEGTVTIYYTLLLERVLNINQQEYTFEAMFYMQFTWKDPRALDAINKFSLLQNDKDYNSNRGCTRFCDNSFDRDWGRFAGANGTSSRKCCDGVWLPTFALRNLAAMPTSRTEPLYLVKVMEDKETVAWRMSLHATFVTAMNFARFPFDTQRLQVILSTTQPTPDKIRIKPSSTAIETFVRGSGDDLSGWSHKGVRLIIDEPVRGDVLLSHGTPVNPDDPAPLTSVNASLAQLANGDVLHNWYIPATSEIHVKRMWEPVVCMAVLPPCFLVYTSLLTCLLGPTWLSKRLSVYVSLILALIALQFVIGRGMPESSYLLPTTKLILMSYAMLGLLAIESSLVYIISMRKALSLERRRFSRARARLKALQ
ncbi:MAG: hypothetical protein J3K34DRAFT_101369 [Monoraphidium minutum]|nr:MAG: hypothetical protein J3K34DRAFT_101369 [Monoraphidium minutum]